LKAGEDIRGHEFSPEAGKEERSAVAILATPSCHPDGAAISRAEKAEAKGFQLRTENRELRTGVRTVFDALGWNMAERLQQSPLLAETPSTSPSPSATMTTRLRRAGTLAARLQGATV